MQIHLGERIRLLRHRDGRTQEALAKAIGVTSQAVSRWEANGGYPDIDTIPAIANYFHVTIDELFGYIGDREARIKSILDEADTQIREVFGLGEYIDTIKAAAEEYPSNVDIQIRFGIVLMMLGFERHGAQSSIPNTAGDGENIVAYNRDNTDFFAALTVFEKILPDIIDPESRETVIRHMVRLYSIRGEYDKAEALVRKQNTISACREVLLPATAVGEMRKIYQGELLLALIWRMANAVISEVTLRYDLRSTHAGIDKVLQMVQLYQNILDDGNYGFGHYALHTLYRLCTKIAAEQALIEEAEAYARYWYMHHCAYSKLKERGGDFRYTAALVDGVTESIDSMPPIKSWEETVRCQPDSLKMLLEKNSFQ